NNPNQFGNQIGDYYMDNIEWLVFTGLGMFVVVIIISVIQMTYPVFYLRLLEKNTDYKPKSGEISSLIRQDFGRVLLFCFATFFVVGFLLFIAYFITLLLMFVI